MNPKYCTSCGSVKLQKPNGHSFDENTSKKIEYFRLVCSNLSCEKGCLEIGHVYPWFSNKCKRCVYIAGGGD